MGNALDPQTLTAQQTVQTTVETMTTIITKRISVCINGVAATQLINVRCNPSPALVTAFETSKACTDCKAQYVSELAKAANCPICYACVDTDLTQSLILSYDPSTCPPFGSNTVSIAKNVTTDIQTQITRQSSYQSALKVWFYNIPRRETFENFVTQIENVITSDDITSILLSMQFNQSINFESEGGSTQSGVVQKINTYSISSVVAKNLTALSVPYANNLLNTSWSQTAANTNKTDDVKQYIVYFTVAFVSVVLLITAIFAFRSPKKKHVPMIVIEPVSTT
jgi:hypothetical protein